MKKIAILSFCFAALLSLGGCGSAAVPNNSGSAPTAELKVSTVVAAKWQDDRYYLGSVQTIAGETYSIALTDGGVYDTTKDHLIIVPNKLDLKVGDRVLSAYTDSGKFYAGVVKEIKPEGALITWDDGSTEDIAPAGKTIMESSTK